MNTITLRATARLLVGGACLSAAMLLAVPAAAAHPLGNFTVNHHTGLVLHPDHIDARVVVDRAEIAAAQELPDVDTDRNQRLTRDEKNRYARAACTTLKRHLTVTAGQSLLAWRLDSSRFERRPGEAGLNTSRLQCALSAPVDLHAPSTLALRTAYDTRRVGWQEITARADSLALTSSDVPAQSPTSELRHYPEDPLAAPLNQRTATLHSEPGRTQALTAVGNALPTTGPLGTALAATQNAFDAALGARELTVPVGLLALLLSLILGASHAAMPGHGKTLMAAYLAGRRGTPRDALTVGATVTFTHTAGVLALGLALPFATHLAGETVLTWLGATSGVIITAIGLWLLRSALLNRTTPNHHHHHGHHHHHDHSHEHGSDHHHSGSGGGEPVGARTCTGSTRTATSQEQLEPGSVAVLTKEREHPHSHSHSHSGTDHAARPSRTRRSGLIGMGIAGGLVPSPSALVVLLGAIALGRTVFGVTLVIAYGMGMAGTLTLAGLLLVRLRDRIEAGLRAADAPRWKRLRRLARYGPIGTSSLVLCVGLGLVVRASAGPW